MNLIGVLILLSMVTSATAQAQDQEGSGSELPKDFPRLGFSINPIYHSIGLKLGHVLNPRRVRVFRRTFEGSMMLGFGTNPRPCGRSTMYGNSSCNRERSREDPIYLD